MKHVAFGERNKNAGGRDRWRERRGRRKENERGREMNLPDVKQTVILVLTKETSAEFCNPAYQP